MDIKKLLQAIPFFSPLFLYIPYAEKVTWHFVIGSMILFIAILCLLVSNNYSLSVSRATISKINPKKTSENKIATWTFVGFPILLLIGIGLIIFGIYSFKDNSYAKIESWRGDWDITIINPDGKIQTIEAKADTLELNKLLFNTKEIGQSKFTPTNNDETHYGRIKGRYWQSGTSQQLFESYLSADKNTFICKIYDNSSSKNTNFTIWHGTKK